MAKVKIQGSASGTGILTVTSPDTSTDRTITLPDATGTLLNSDGDGSSLTGLTATLAALTDATVSASDPTESTNPSAVGHLWVNSTSGEQYICTDATAGSNVWTNTGEGTGAVPLPYNIDYLVIAGGGQGGDQHGGGAGAGGYRNSYNNETSGGGGSSETAMTVNENTVYNFGSWLVFDSNGQHDFTLPSESENIYPSNCYTIVVIGYNQQDEYVSEPFIIY